MRAARRLWGAAAGHAHGGGHGASAEYGGFHAPHVAPVHRYMSIGVGTLMWSWIFYRAYHDGPALIGLHHPWEHGSHGDEDEEDGGEEELH